ncbi:MAG: HD domain-containing protein [Thermoflavifilum sp.]|nr:HD domain-containing protein [Thermoflavifilum sp.]
MTDIPAFKKKIINDPVYGFISIDHPLVFQLIEHPWYQRLRRIHQMALAQLVFPGAVHTRFQHSLGAYHLLMLALQELKNKGIAIDREEETAVKLAVLLHDAGHGPFSHALEGKLVEGIGHETISRMIIRQLIPTMGSQMEMALAIFDNQYPRRFLHQLVSSQLDVDRMDYLMRDSFYTGVAEGVIGYDRILKMLTVLGDELMVEEKAIYSIEKFIIARRLMYWQVYLHKTVLSAETMLVKIVQRAKDLCRKGVPVFATPALQFFLQTPANADIEHPDFLHYFCALDDEDVLACIKVWTQHEDPILATLSRALIYRRLFRLELSDHPIAAERITTFKEKCLQAFPFLDEETVDYFVYSDTATSYAYNPADENIRVLFKNHQVRDISEVENSLINHTVSIPIKKFYICYPKLLLERIR